MDTSSTQKNASAKTKGWGGCLGALVVLAIVGFCFYEAVLSGPCPVVEDVVLWDRPGFDFAWVANIKVRNYGAGGKVLVRAELKYGNFWKKETVVDVASGEMEAVQIVFDEPTFLEGIAAGNAVVSVRSFRAQ